MVKYIRAMILVLTISIIGTVNAFAGNLSEQDIKNVIQALHAMDSKQLPEAMGPLNDFADGKYKNLLDEDGNLEVFSKMFDVSLEPLESMEEYRHLQSIAQTAGFASVRKWAEKSDDVLMAYMLSQMSNSLLEALAAMTQEEIYAFPKEEQPDVVELKKMAAAMLALPQDDIDTFAPYITKYNDALK